MSTNAVTRVVMTPSSIYEFSQWDANENVHALPTQLRRACHVAVGAEASAADPVTRMPRSQEAEDVGGGPAVFPSVHEPVTVYN